MTLCQIELPHSFPQPGIDIVDAQFLGQDGALPAEDTEITNGKQLYQNFKRLLKAGENKTSELNYTDQLADAQPG